MLARTATEVTQTAKLAGGDALALTADVTDPGQMAEAVAAIGRRWGPVQILINNAGVVWPLSPSVDLDVGEWERALTVNLIAVARLTFAVLPDMVNGGWGRIVNVSSGIVASPAGMPRANAYVTSKAALEAHTLNLAAELDGTGVTANVFRPGGVDTAMQAFIRSGDPHLIGAALHGRFIRSHAEGNLLTPDQSATHLLSRLAGTDTAQIWDAAAPPTTPND